MAIKITKCTNTANTTSCAKRTPKYLVIHYTAGTKSSSGTAMSIAKYFAKPTTKASADFIVDDANIVQYNPDPTTRYCWAVGGSKYSKPSTSVGGKLYGVAKNANCISIELCSSKKNTKSLSATDTDWYFTDAVLNNGVELAKYLMGLYNIPIENVILHHEVTGKICPNPFCVNQASLVKWSAFKTRLTSNVLNPKQETTSTSAKTTNTTFKQYVVKVLVADLNIRNNPGTTGTKVTGKCTKGIKYTITEEKTISGTKWGKLKSGMGWISLSSKYVSKV